MKQTTDTEIENLDLQSDEDELKYDMQKFIRPRDRQLDKQAHLIKLRKAASKEYK